jgi:hypothetical protein
MRAHLICGLAAAVMASNARLLLTRGLPQATVAGAPPGEPVAQGLVALL